MSEPSALKPSVLIVDDELQIRRLLKEVWGPNYLDQTHYLRVYIAHLREKLEPDPAQPRLILTEPGIGYRWMEEPPIG